MDHFPDLPPLKNVPKGPFNGPKKNTAADMRVGVGKEGFVGDIHELRVYYSRLGVSLVLHRQSYPLQKSQWTGFMNDQRDDSIF